MRRVGADFQAALEAIDFTHDRLRCCDSGSKKAIFRREKAVLKLCDARSNTLVKVFEFRKPLKSEKQALRPSATGGAWELGTTSMRESLGYRPSGLYLNAESIAPCLQRSYEASKGPKGLEIGS